MANPRAREFILIFFHNGEWYGYEYPRKTSKQWKHVWKSIKTMLPAIKRLDRLIVMEPETFATLVSPSLDNLDAKS